MKAIKLTQGKIAVIDDEDFEIISALKWFAHKQSKANTYYAERNIKLPDGKRKPIGMHILIMDPPHGHQVDHIDGDGLNNRRSNLRVCVCSQNQGNARIRKDCSSGVKGVSFSKSHKRWRARIQINRNRIGLGWHLTKAEAAKAYAVAAVMYFGEFARPETIQNGRIEAR